ncbi:MAG: TetR/AcrR family transcriptional regulator [Mycobacteriaceae bacterium]|nr:TetR/AcrR family transcriptional regulator [Mycobacteriaceae bacterium]
MRSAVGIWGGRTAEERRAERRQRLIEAATEIWSESGWAAVTMRGVCSRASLNDRYFYEDFADRDALLVAVWDSVRDELVTMVRTLLAENTERRPLEILGKGTSIVVERISGAPGRAQILLGHHAGSAVLENRRGSMLQLATELIVVAAGPYLKPDADQAGLRIDTLLCIGGFVELISAWQAGLIDADAQLVIDHAHRLGATLAAQYLVG